MEKAQRKLLLFLVFLSGLTNFTFGAPYRNENHFNEFRNRLEQAIHDSSADVLPFVLKSNLNEDLMLTANDFKDLCLHFEVNCFNENNHYNPVQSLIGAINTAFNYYKQSANGYENILEHIESVDPIGLNVYLNANKVTFSSPTFIQYVSVFYATMNDRLWLLNMKTNDSYIQIFDENEEREIDEVPDYIRERITTEFASIVSDTIEFFTEIVMEHLGNMKMYPLDVSGNVEYKQHHSKKVDDVQILFDYIESGHQDIQGNAVGGHTKCIYYKASVQKVYVYDSAMSKSLTPKEQHIIQILYPFNKGVLFKRPKTIQDHRPTCAIFSMFYSLILLLKEDPAKYEIKLNKVHGDETIYMRWHLMNIFANRKLVLLK